MSIATNKTLLGRTTEALSEALYMAISSAAAWDSMVHAVPRSR